MRVIGIIVLFIAAIIIGGPWATGIYFERNYDAILTFYSAHGINVKKISYTSGWFSSDATIQLEINNPQYIKALQLMGIDPNEAPKQYVIDQHIQHGPILYHYVDGLPSVFGLAAINNTLRS